MSAEDKVALEVGRLMVGVLRAYNKRSTLTGQLKKRMLWMQEAGLPTGWLSLVVDDLEQVEAAANLNEEVVR